MKIEFAPPALDVAKTKEAMVESIPTVVVTPEMCTKGTRNDYYLEVSTDMIVQNGFSLVFGKDWVDIGVATAGIFTVAISVQHTTTDEGSTSVGPFIINLIGEEFVNGMLEAGIKIGQIFSMVVNGTDVTGLMLSQEFSAVKAERIGRAIDAFVGVGTGAFVNANKLVPPPIIPPVGV